MSETETREADFLGDQDERRCTCAMTDPGVYHGDNMHPPQWEQDPWCPVHPHVEAMHADYAAARAEVAALRSDMDRIRVEAESNQSAYERAAEERATAERQVAALRSAVSAAADMCRSLDDQLHDDPSAFQRGSAAAYRKVRRDLCSLLASVGSSGEAGPVLLAWHTCTSCRGRTLGRPGARCSHCNGDTEVDTDAVSSSGEAEGGEAPVVPAGADLDCMTAGCRWGDPSSQRCECRLTPDVVSAVLEAYHPDGVALWLAQWASGKGNRARMVAGVLAEWSGEPAVPGAVEAPAPVSSGGQADGEGERRLSDDVVMPRETLRERIKADGSLFAEGVRVGREEADGEHRIAAALAVRPVLSREADDDAVDAIHRLSQWIDDGNKGRDPEAITWGRLAKITEEAGEVIAAYIGSTGQNPRKGITHTAMDVQEELLDVAVTALGAVAHLHGNDGEDVLALLRHKIERVAERALHADVLTAGGEQE